MKQPRASILPFALLATFLLAACGSATPGDRPAPPNAQSEATSTPAPPAQAGAGTDTDPSEPGSYPRPEGAPPMPPAPGGPPDGAQIVAGVVENVNGSTLTLAPMEGPSVTVELTDGANVRTVADAAFDSIEVGETITAVGVLEGSTLQAMRIQVTDEGTTSGSPPAIAAPGGAIGPGGAEVVQSGVVEQIDGEILTIADGAAEIRLAEEGVVQRVVAASAAGIRPQSLVIAAGEWQGELFQATQVTILPEAELP